MERPLNIPLNSHSTRHRSWRVVWIAALFILTFLSVWTIFQLLYRADSTTSLRPEASTHSFRFLITPRNGTLIDEHLGSEVLFTGHPWTLSDFLQYSQKSTSIHLENEAPVGITIDGQISDTMKQDLQFRGLTITELGRNTLVSTTNAVTQSKRLIFHTSAIFPKYDGSLYEFTEEAQKSRIRLSNHGIRVQRGYEIPSPIFHVAPPENSQVYSYFPTLSSNNAFPAILETLVPLENTRKFIVSSIQDPGLSLIGEDEHGLFSYVVVKNTQFTSEELARIGEELINRKNLTTTALTLPDGTRVSELRARKGDIASDINVSGDETRISLSNSDGELVELLMTGDWLVVSNRKIALSTELTVESSCNQHFTYFVRPNEVLNSIRSPLSISGGSNGFAGYFSEIAFSETETLYCW